MGESGLISRLDTKSNRKTQNCRGRKLKQKSFGGIKRKTNYSLYLIKLKF